MGKHASFFPTPIAYLHKGIPHRTTQVVVFVGTLRRLIKPRSDSTDRKIIVFQPGQRYMAITGKSPPSEYH